MSDNANPSSSALRMTPGKPVKLTVNGLEVLLHFEGPVLNSGDDVLLVVSPHHAQSVQVDLEELAE